MVNKSSAKEEKIESLDIISHEWCEEEGFERVLVRYRIREIEIHSRGKRLLDLGCGVGIVCRAMAKKMDQVVGVDGSSKKILQAKRLTKNDNVTYVHSLFDDFVPNKIFDTIVLTNVLEHIQEPVDLLRRAWSWLKPGGIVIATVPNALALHKRIGKHMGLIKNYYELTEADLSKGHKRIYDANRLRNDIEAAGLQVVVLKGVFLKPLSSSQMEIFSDDELFDALYEVGKELPEFCSSLLVCAEKII